MVSIHGEHLSSERLDNLRKLDEQTRLDIEDIVSNDMDNLEDMVNVRLKNLLAEANIHDKDALLYAREIFFYG